MLTHRTEAARLAASSDTPRSTSEGSAGTPPCRTFNLVATASVRMPSAALCVNFLGQVEAIARAQLELAKGKALFFAHFLIGSRLGCPAGDYSARRSSYLARQFRVDSTHSRAAERLLRRSHGGP